MSSPRNPEIQDSILPEEERTRIIRKTKSDLEKLQLDWETMLHETGLTEIAVAKVLYERTEAGPALRVNPDESVETQRRGLFELERSLATLHLSLAHQNLPIPENLADFPRVFTPTVIASFPPSESAYLKLMLWKIQKITEKKEGSISQYLNTQWKNVIANTSLSPEINTGIDGLKKSIAEGKMPPAGNEIIELVKKYWAPLLMVGIAGWGLYKLFDMFGGKKEKSPEQGFFGWIFSLLSKIPGITGVGMLVILSGIFGLFGKNILEWFGSGDSTLAKVMKFVENPTLDSFLNIMGVGGNGDKNPSPQSGGSSLVDRAIDWGKAQIGMNEAKSEESHEARAEAVGTSSLARYAFMKPWEKASDLQKTIFHSGTKRGEELPKFSKEGAEELLQKNTARYTEIIKNPDEVAQVREQAIGKEFEKGNGKHPKYGTIEDGIKSLDTEQKSLAGIDDLISPEEAKKRYLRYLALSEVNLEARALEYHMTALRASMDSENGARIYKEFMEQARTPEKYLLELQAFQVQAAENLRTLPVGTNESLREYAHLRGKLDDLLEIKNTQVDTLMREIEVEVQKQGGYATGENLTTEEKARNLKIDTAIESKVKKVGMIEKEVAEISTRFMKENEQVIIRMLQNKGVGKTLAFRFRQYIPNIRNIKNVEGLGKKWKAYRDQRNPTSVHDLETRGKNKYFRVSTVGGGLVITGLGAGWAFMNSAEGEGIDNALATGGRIAGGMVPLLAEYLDARDAIDALSKGEYLNTMIYSGAFVADVASTLMIASGVFSGVGFGLKAGKSAVLQGIKSGTIREVAREGNELIIKGAKGVILKKLTLSANDLKQVTKIQKLVQEWGKGAKYALWSGMAVSLGGTSVAVAGAYLGDDGKLDIDDHTPSKGETEE